MGVKLAIQKEVNSATDQPAIIPFEFKGIPEGKNVGDKLIIYPITVRTWFRMKPYLLMIEKADIDKILHKEGTAFDESIRDVIVKYDELILEMIFLGIHNRKGDLPTWFKEILKDSCTWEDMFIIFNAIVYRLGTQSFLNTIIAAKAVSPLDERGIIALQENKDTWTLKAVLHS